MNALIKPKAKLFIERPLGNGKQAYWMFVGGTRVFLSYSTPMAFEGHLGGQPVRFRRDDYKSRTTARHMSAVGVSGWPRLDDSSFDEKLEAAVLEGIHPLLAVVKELTP